MLTTKQQFRKTEGRQFYHFVQSFAEDDPITPAEANAIGLELAQREFSGFEVVIATHVDTNHIHNHLAVNSVSCVGGKKLHQSADDLLAHRKANDEICLAHGLSTLERPEKPARDCSSWGNIWNRTQIYRLSLRRREALIKLAHGQKLSHDSHSQSQGMMGY